MQKEEFQKSFENPLEEIMNLQQKLKEKLPLKRIQTVEEEDEKL